ARAGARRARPRRRQAGWRPPCSPRLHLIAGPHVVSVLIDPQPPVLIKKLAPQQAARILRHSPQPLLRRLLRRPFAQLLVAQGRIARARRRRFTIISCSRLPFPGLLARLPWGL